MERVPIGLFFIVVHAQLFDLSKLNRDSRFLGNIGCHIGCIWSIYVRCLNTKSEIISWLVKDLKFKGLNFKSKGLYSALVVVARETSAMQL